MAIVVTPPVMAEGERRIPDVVGSRPPICIHHPTVKHLAGKRLDQIEVVRIISLSAGAPLEDHCVRFMIGLDRDGALMVTPNLDSATHLVWERWTGPEPLAWSP